jgi:isopentenyl phosphate kinase
MLIFLKLGGSLITDKRQPETARLDVLARLAAEVAAAQQTIPDLKLVIGNGAGSFGHVPARKHGTRQGVHSPAQWFGFAETADAAARLNRRVAHALLEAGVPAWSIQPSAALRCEDGRIVEGPLHSVAQALRRGLTPLVHGDVALDDVRGGTIASTEEIFEWLARVLPAALPQDEHGTWTLRRMVLAGEVDGIYTADPLLDARAVRVASVTGTSFQTLRENVGGSHGVDVTGGMAAKVAQALAWVERHPGTDVIVCSGLISGNVHAALDLRNRATVGTRIHADQP